MEDVLNFDWPTNCNVQHSFIHSGLFYSVSSSPLLLTGAPDTARILCRSFTPKRHRQLRATDLPKVPTLYVAARAGFEPTTPRTIDVESTNEPPCPTVGYCKKLAFKYAPSRGVTTSKRLSNSHFYNNFVKF